MYNFFNRHYIFRRSDGQMTDIYCDGRQNLCSRRLGGKSSLPDPTVLAMNVHPYIYAEMDERDVYHVAFQDDEGNINYMYMDGRWSGIIPVLKSRAPAAYNKQLYIAPFKNSIYLFYVLHHDNSFLLAYQTVVKGKAGTPKIVDYVSGSNIPCSIIYDQDENIYAFYQSYDGKYLQLGYKKMDTARKHWSDFISVTKFMGNCEYPHAIIDAEGTIHLCYQRRTQKQYELVYQQKGKDKNLWSGETVLHSSSYPFENASVVQAGDKITVYWIRDDVIFYTAGRPGGDGWSRPARYASQPGRQLQCICWKEQTAGRDPGRYDQASSASPAPSPGIYPGTLSNGVRLAFIDISASKAVLRPTQFEPFAMEGGPYAGEMKDKVMESIKLLQENVNEINAGWTVTKKELARITNAYGELIKEVDKISLRLSLLENKIKEISNPYRSAVVIADDKSSGTGDSSPEGTAGSRPGDASPSAGPVKVSPPEGYIPGPENLRSMTGDIGRPPEKPGSSLDPEARKIWEEWQEPKEWSEGP
jgi:hypothetical protein